MPARFFIDGFHTCGEEVELRAGDAHKIIAVLRLRSGDAVEVIDSAGFVFPACLVLRDSHVGALLAEPIGGSVEPTLRITLAQGIPKGQKMDFVVEKATELGIARIIPFVSERVIGEERSASKIERWRRLARTAAQQSGRTHIPPVDDPLSWKALIAAVPAFDLVLLPWELAERTPLRMTLPRLLRADAREALVIIGPEGGITHAEADAALAAGAHAVSLGSRILRTETAGIVACTALLYESGDI
jgi:16S rRNA (uracil1498-N3)-methyltransferase